jgi:hypothetical protein
MSEENENIHLYIIEQEYKRNKAEQNAQDGSSSEEAKKRALTEKINPAAIRKLKKMHPKFKVIEAREAVQRTEELGQVKGPQIEESIAPDILDLLASFQEMRTEERELLETKEDLLAKKRDLQSKLVEEIGKKKIAIDVLKSEVQSLQDQCKEIAQALGIAV